MRFEGTVAKPKLISMSADPSCARLEREKRIKGWLRIKKIALIVSMNPSWKDLSEEWYERHQYQPRSA